MPRSKVPSPVAVDQFPLEPQDQARLAHSLGLDALPPECAAVVGEVIAAHLKAVRTQHAREQQTTAGSVKVVINRAIEALRPFTAIDSGVDADTNRKLRPSADRFVAAAAQRLRELQAMPRVYPERELLRETCSWLRLIFERHAAPDFRADLHARRQFAFDALTAARIRLPGIDEAHLTRLDEFLDALPQLSA